MKQTVLIKFKGIETYFQIDKSKIDLQIILLKRKLGLLALHEWEIIDSENSKNKNKNNKNENGNTNQSNDSNSHNDPDLLVSGDVTKPKSLPKATKPRKTKS